MRKLFAVSVLFSSQILWAQRQSAPRQSLPGDSQAQSRIEQEAFEQWALDPADPKSVAAGKEAEAVQEFYSKARHFVDLWQAFANELNDKKTFNAKLAKQVSKAFHDMEKSDGWPVGRPK
jgi:hypothetical protein